MKDKLEQLGFPLGSRVVLVQEDPTGYVEIGQQGVVCHYTSEWEHVDGCNIGIELDEEKAVYHNCKGHCGSDRGRYVPHTAIARVDLDLGEIEASGLTLESLF